jgi:transposase
MVSACGWLVSKFADHIPLYRLQGMLARAGVAIPQSTLGQWVGVCGVRLMPLVQALKTEVLTRPVLHADETPVSMLDPGAGKTKKAYLWAYTPTQFDALRAVVYDFTPGRAGANAREFLGDWAGGLVTDDYGGYKALFAAGVTELGCMAHARRKFFELHANHQSQIAGQALDLIGALYEIERQAAGWAPDARQRLRHEQSRPIAQTHARMANRASAATARWLGYGARHRLQPESLAGAHALSE